MSAVRAVVARLGWRRPTGSYATFQAAVTVPAAPLPPHDAMDLLHCPRHGITAHRITPTSATCWTCNPNGGQS